MAAGSDGASLKKAPALVPGPSLVKGVYKTPECSVGNLCEDLVSQYGREVGFLRPSLMTEAPSDQRPPILLSLAHDGGSDDRKKHLSVTAITE